MSGEAAARSEPGMAGGWPVGADAAEPAEGLAGPPGSSAAGDAPTLTLPTLVQSGGGEGAVEAGVEVVGGGADPRSVLDALLSAAANLIGQAIELHRGLEAVSRTSPAEDDPDPSLAGLVADYERRLIEAALQRTRGNRAQAARLLRTTERILGYRVQRYGIDCDAFRG